MKLKLITREPADHLRHWAGYQAAIFDGVPTAPTERLIAVLKNTKHALLNQYLDRRMEAFNEIEALLKELGE